jgi:hyperosmotically inducible periplasmic protein
MRKRVQMSFGALGMTLALLLLAKETAGQSTQTKVDESLSRMVHHQLLMLPYYSVFDNLTYTIEGSKVTLSGQVVRPTLKENAEAAMRNIEGVVVVVNTIEVLPKSATDNDLRRAVYRAIFEDEVLKQYAVQAVPPIHIIVKNGALALEGSVKSSGDKVLAGEKAAGVSGVQGVANHLVVREKETAAK